MVCEHREGQSAECMEDSLWCQHIPVEGVVLRSELWHLSRWQIHCDRIRWQEGHRLRGHLLERKEAPAPAPALRMRWLLLSLFQSVDYNTHKLQIWKSYLVEIDGAVGWRMLELESFLSFLFWRVYFWVTHFFVTSEFPVFPWEYLGVTQWSGASFLRTLFPQTSCEKCTYRIK